MHRDWWGLSRDTRVSFLSLFLFFARSFSPIGRSSLLCLYPTGCLTRFSPFFPSFLIPRVCFFFTFHIFVNRTVGVSSGKKLTLFFLVSCPVSLPISSPFKLKKITYDRSTFVNPSISIQTRYRSLSYKRNGCPIVSKRFSLSRSLPLPVPSSPLHPAATLEVIFGSVHTSTIPSDLRRRRYLVGRPTGESARLNGAKDKE